MHRRDFSPKSGHLFTRVAFVASSANKTCFSLPFSQDSMFSQDNWFRKPINRHLDNPRLVIARKFNINKKQCAKSATKCASDVSTVRSFTRLDHSRMNTLLVSSNKTPKGRKKTDHLQKVESADHVVHAPEYYSNIFKPCHIQAIKITHRPSTGKKNMAEHRSFYTRRRSENSYLSAEKPIAKTSKVSSGHAEVESLRPWDPVPEEENCLF